MAGRERVTVVELAPRRAPCSLLSQARRGSSAKRAIDAALGPVGKGGDGRGGGGLAGVGGAVKDGAAAAALKLLQSGDAVAHAFYRTLHEDSAGFLAR